MESHTKIFLLNTLNIWQEQCKVFIINQTNGYIEKNNRSKYLTLFHTNENIDT